ncbi:Ig-like domain-containing protein [Hyalangium rubrum]|uniref:Ig-like domain-containing protein n=1 Tax=Hyalangium rubrum TaxID=3103134 RepID=A0ABU5HIS3_9BACT|nr:Ig-like domain-containing protein [Hyalangium sp. s54d21]MDY7233344.1 Ig-like domain-containing protein [Hyalangium sp. s54d21]
MSYECQLDDETAFTACPAPPVFNELGEGPHVLKVRAKDRADNMDASPAEHSWTVDTLPPSTTIEDGPDTYSSSATATFEFDSDEAPNVSYECQLDDETAFTACPTPPVFNGLSEGLHMLKVRAKDLADNVDASPAEYPWTVDALPPTTTIDDGPEMYSPSATATFEFSSDEAPNVSYECQLDDETAFTACPTPPVFNALDEGPHVLKVRAKDPEGNEDGTPAEHHWTVDTVLPDTSIAGPPSYDSSTSPMFVFMSNETPNVSYECQLDDETAFTECPTPPVFSGLGEGPHVLKVRAKDRADNVDASPAEHPWTVDTVAPTTSVTGPVGHVSSTSASFEFDSNEAPNVSYECQLDDEAAFTECPTPPVFSGLDEGAHVLKVRAKDRANNVDASPAEHPWTVDTVAPTTTVTGPVEHVSSTSATFVFSSNEAPNVSYECQLDDETAFTECPTPPVFSGLDEGAHVLKVRAKDLANNVDASPAEHSWTVDTVAPTTTVTGPVGHVSSTSATFEFGSDEAPNVSYECQLDDETAFTACPTPPVFNGLSNGPHVLKVRAKDLADNVDASPDDHSWTVDTLPPSTTIDDGPEMYSPSATATFEFSSDEAPNVSYECQLDDETAFTACPTPPVFNGLSNGPHVLKVRAKDRAGNVDASPDDHSWTVDMVAPTTAIDDGPEMYSPSATATFEFSSEEAEVTYECRLNSTAEQDFAPCPTPYTLTVPADGAYLLEVRAKDRADNVDASPARHSWSVDTMKPETTITPGTPEWTNSPSITFSFSSNETGVTYECRLNSTVEQGFAVCSTPYTVTVTTDGAYILDVRARDQAGNADASPADRRWNLDRVSPVTTITGGPEEPTNSTSAAFSFTSNEVGSTFKCRRSGETDFQPCTSPVTYQDLPDGPHWFQVFAIDRANNADGTVERRDWSVDTAAPETQIDSTPPADTNSTTATFRFSVAGNTAEQVTYECRLGDGAWDAVCVSPKSYSGLGQGRHTFQVRARDAVGNVDTDGAGYSWNVDLEAPAPPSIEEPLEGSYTNLSIISVTGRAEALSSVSVFVNGVYQGLASVSGAGTWERSVNIGVFEDGQLTLHAEAKDAADNVSGGSVLRKFFMDRRLPLVNIVTMPPQLGKDRDVLFRFDSDEETQRYECSNDGSRFSECPNPYEMLGLADRSYNLYVRAVDLAGNASNPAKRYTWIIDTRAPAVQVVSPHAGALVNVSKPRVSGTGEAFATVNVYIRSEEGEQFVGSTSVEPGENASAPGAWELESSVPFPNGTHYLSVEALDAAGNLSPRTEDISFTIDTEPPETQILEGPDVSHGSRTVDFVVKSPSGARAFECSLDETLYVDCQAMMECAEEDPSDCTGAVRLNLKTAGTKRVEGWHDLLIRARDQAGNVDPTPEPYRWEVVITPPPAPIITSPQEGAVVVGLLTIRGTAAKEGQVRFFLGERIDSSLLGSAPIISEQWELTKELAAGTYTILVDATDKADNTGDPSQVTFSVVPAKPQASAVGGGLGCAASDAQPWVALVGLLAGAGWNARRRKMHSACAGHRGGRHTGENTPAMLRANRGLRRLPQKLVLLAPLDSHLRPVVGEEGAEDGTDAAHDVDDGGDGCSARVAEHEGRGDGADGPHVVEDLMHLDGNGLAHAQPVVGQQRHSRDREAQSDPRGACW